MRQQTFRAISWIGSAIVVSSCLPMASACDTSGFLSGHCSFSEPTMIGLIIGGVICSAYVRRRRVRSRPARIRRLSYGPNDMEANPQKPWNTPVAYSPPGYGQPSPSVPWSPQAPRYPPPMHDTQYNGYRSGISSQWSSPTTLYPIPEPSTPTSPLSTRPSSSAITSRPTPSIDTTPASLRPTVQRDDTTRMRPQPSSTSLASRSPQNNVTEVSLPPVTSFLPPQSPPMVAEFSSTPASSSPAPQSPQRIVAESPLPSVASTPPSRRPTVDIPPLTSPPRRPSVSTLQFNSPPPIVLSPMPTGATSNVTDPPPPYTPI
ncbi:hypothetical protein JVU11DRAFT_9475 [Chiua virens]|nr:hypothetical protein JVU11DRAFT_9475 [Chiua virens]